MQILELPVSYLFVFLLLLCLTPLAALISNSRPALGYCLTPLIFVVSTVLFYIFGELIDQPHPTYEQGTWLTHAIDQSMDYIPASVVIIAILMAVDVVVQTGRTRDPLYFTRADRFVRALLASRQARLLFIVGSVPIVLYFLMTVIEMVSQEERRAGLVWPPKRVFITCCYVWGLYWFIECWQRPKKGTIAAAIGLLILVCICLPVSFGVLRE